MPRQPHPVTYHRRQLERDERPLPPLLNEYVGVVEHLGEANILREIASRFHLHRTGGYVGFDLVMSLLAYVSCILTYPSLGKFCGYIRRYFNRSMGAVVGRRDFPSQPSMSRMLDVVDDREVAALERWLLIDALEGSPVWDNESVLHRDCEGKGWHVFSFDHTSTVLRRRALPEGPDLPLPKRHTDGFASSGYPGRKRGEVMVARGTLQHRGTRLWHGLTLNAGNGDLKEDLGHGAECIKLWAECAQVALEDCIVVIDGATGGWTQLEVLAPMSLRFAVRLTYYHPLKDPQRLADLLAQPWTVVRDSLSGPKRLATEMGTIERDGRAVRLIVTRFQPTDGKKHGAGVLIDGWQYEVFATNLKADQWPAAELVTLYYGRCGEENDFAREDAALNLDHVASFNPSGQCLFNLIGLWLWNLRILRGAQLHGGLETVSYPQECRSVTVEQSAHRLEREPSTETVDVQLNSCSSTDDDGLLEEKVRPTSIVSAPQPEPLATFDIDQVGRQLVAKFEARFGDNDGWAFALDSWSIVCPAEHQLNLQKFRTISKEIVQVRFCGSKSHCRTCSRRGECASSTGSSFAKEITARVRLPSEPSHPPAVGPADGIKPNTALDRATRLLPTRKQSINELSSPKPPDLTIAPGPLQMRQPFLVTAVLVNMLLDYTRGLLIHVHTNIGQLPVATPTYYSMSDAERQKRRKTWTQRMNWNALPENSTVTVDIASPESYRLKYPLAECARAA